MDDDHRHCRICGRVCAVGNETCSRACAEKREAQQRSRQTNVRLMYLLIVVVAVVFLLQFV
ncbi:MAG TPA: DUF2116 family Zn-ribbon domain-containing protein [Thermoplasmata archaeon]|nr:DUF2116 family Zn-ribbon domain-containing protein [Thermoplasmata archaeon]HUJ78473.1 DUF2116 family Zn-ribbon domain-containing protein [Thermoplasmata archaeon]